MTLEPAADADIPAIVALMNRAYRRKDEPGWTTEAAYIEGDRTTPEVIRADLASDPQAVFLVSRAPAGAPPDRAVEACVFLAPKAGAVWGLGALTVDPGLQNAGAGRRLLDAAEAWARARGGATIQITVVHLRGALIAWYERRGFRATGETAPFPYGDERMGRPTREDLTFVVMEKGVG